MRAAARRDEFEISNLHFSIFNPARRPTPPAPPLRRGGRTRGCASRLTAGHGRSSSSRRGLAPLELVLSLFFLLVIMALIINFGTTAPWHVRGQIAARHAVWRTLSGRTGSVGYPNPPNWWPPATMGT